MKPYLPYRPYLPYMSGASIVAFSPADLFANSEVGAWYDPSDLTTLFQDSAGTTPVTADGQPVGKSLDKSGRGNHASQATSTKRPVLSSRVNLLTKTEDFTAATWVKSGVTVTSSTVTFGASNTNLVSQDISYSDTSPSLTLSALLSCPSGTNTVYLGITHPAVADYGSEVTITTAPTWFTFTQALVGAVTTIRVRLKNNNTGTSNTVNVGGFQLVPADQASLPYQRVNTDTDYDTVGFPKFANYDAVDDVLDTAFASSLGADCTVARAVVGGEPVILTGQTIDTSYAASTDNAGLVIVNRALNIAETASLTTYLTEKGAYA